MAKITQASIPMKNVGPVLITGSVIDGEKILMPMATYETPLWPSVGRGALVSRLCGGIQTTIVDERMTRSILLEAKDAASAFMAVQQIKQLKSEMNTVVSSCSRFAKLIDINSQIVANLIYLRLEFTTGDASGHNMVTLAADTLFPWLLEKFPTLSYSSISANYCSDKKATAVNGILGRGKNVITEMWISREICEKRLKTTPEKMVDLNIKKNLLGTLLAGGIRSANAHYANMLLAFYLATGQDAANIVEGSQGITYAEVKDDQLYFSCTLPNLIVGSVGNGKGLDFVEENLTLIGCKADREPGENARRLAAICAASVCCGELSLLAAQTNPGELMATHIKLERKK